MTSVACPPAAELALFRVLQESLGNVHRHSGSATASIRLARTADSVRLEVRDAGCGLPAITTNKHTVLQILVNLIRNAKHACDDAKGTEKKGTVRVTHGDGRVRIQVSDNGVGEGL